MQNPTGTGIGIAYVSFPFGRFDGEPPTVREEKSKMQVREIMTENPATATPDMGLKEVARLMKDCDCGAIPVVDGQDNCRPIGVVTDRDIVIRCLADGKNPLDCKAGDAMSSQVITIYADERLEDALRAMEENEIRRIVVVDENDQCIGMLSQADIALNAPAAQTAELVRDVSEPTEGASNLAA